MQDEAAAIFQRIAAADSGNQNLLRCMSVLGLSRGMALRHACRGDEARPLLLAAVQALPVKPPPGFDGRRRRSGTLLWAVRVGMCSDAALALGWAQQAQTPLQAGPVPDGKAARRWRRRWVSRRYPCSNWAARPMRWPLRAKRR